MNDHSNGNISAHLQKQYATSDNFNSRVSLVSRFGTNPQPFTRWIFDHLVFPEKARVLELGCGPGYLWYGNLDRLPSDVRVTLTDFSPGMVETAKNGLGPLSGAFEFAVADAQQIPYADASLDIVIANHMLYHVPDRPKALSEIRRVLKPGGVLYTSTIGRENLKELRELLRRCFGLPPYASRAVADAFGLENGAEQLDAFFDDVRLDLYEDHLEVTEATPMVDYLLSSASMKAVLTAERVYRFKKYLDELIARDGFVYLTKAAGLFMAEGGVL